MLRSSCWRVGRPLLFTGLVASCVGVAGEASARYGMVPPVRSTSSAPREGTRPFPGATAPQCGVITYCGGPVLSNVEIVPVYWTNQVSTTITSWAETYLQTLAGSQLLDMLSEYSTVGKTGEACGMTTDAGLMYFGPATPFSTGQTVTRGTALPAVTITPTVTTGTNIPDDNAAIGAELTAQIAAGKLPAPTYDAQGYPNTIYFVFFPSSYSITLQNMQSCGAFGGYHYSTSYKAPASCKGQYVPYAVIPDCGSDTNGLSSICSHELAEAISDTDVGPTTPLTSNYGDDAWYLGPSYPCNSPQNCPSNCGEVGDVCQNQGDATVPGTSIISQNIWSQAQNGCGVNNPATAAQPGPSGPPLTQCIAAVPDAGTTPDAGKPPGDGGGVQPGSDASVGPTRDGGSTGPTGGSDSGGGGGGGGAGADASTGGNGDTPGSSTGCACSTTSASASGGLGAAAGLLGLTLLGRMRRRFRRG